MRCSARSAAEESITCRTMPATSLHPITTSPQLAAMALLSGKTTFAAIFIGDACSPTVPPPIR